ncbi:MAG: 1-acyl-sn-glycerol-3-phosphate acyltransferase [Candidatus Bipolaricaulota bacterium]|nr:1-acyl-sn-glycerol-3-phosphate acyltransferase [Candidatus Bipolaricaulota bacterium]MDW8126223.1 lysophospholipid acyltransferase family protein [Candidatus Bipolaricaulota bacterium]
MLVWLLERIRDLFYALLVGLATPLIWGAFRLSVKGRPASRGLVVAPHRSYWDIPILCVAFGPFRRIVFLARHGLLRNPAFAPFVWGFAVVINREEFGPRDFRKTMRAAKRARWIGIFPEGTTRPGAKPKPGAIRFAELLNLPFIPVRIVPHGNYPPRPRWRFPKVEVRIGQPFTVEDLAQGLPQDLPKPERYRVLSQRLMERLLSL